jgi:hypothetical protein
MGFDCSSGVRTDQSIKFFWDHPERIGFWSGAEFRVWKPDVQDMALGIFGCQAMSPGLGCFFAHLPRLQARLWNVSSRNLNLNSDVAELTRELCDIESVSGNEREIADAIESALRLVSHLSVVRDGDAVVASTNLGRSKRVIIAGHIDTVPVADNLPTKLMLSASRLSGVAARWI